MSEVTRDLSREELLNPGDEEQDDNITRKIIVHINGQNYTILDDDGDLEIRNKLTGFGISMQQNGDVMVLSGSGGSGKACGGRFLVNAQGGSMHKSGGTMFVEATASEPPVVEQKAKTSDNQGNNDVARSDTYSGDWMINSTGKVHIHAKDITLDAVDNLRLSSQNNIQIQAGVEGSGDIQINSASITQKSDLLETHSSKEVTKVKEINWEQLDPRASINFVSAGHWNQKFKGDYVSTVLGCAKLHVGGATSGVANPEITDRTTAFSVTTLVGNMTINAAKSMLFAVGGVAFPSALDVGSISMESKTMFKVDSGAAMDLKAEGIAKLEAKGNVTVKSDAVTKIEAKGILDLDGEYIYLN